MIFIGYKYQDNQIKWKKIYWMNGEETKYSISNIGKVRNDKKNKILKTNFFKGYERLILTHNSDQKQFFIHRLVAESFVPNPENKSEVNHINGIKDCNYDFNLEWVTHSENELHAYKTGLLEPISITDRNYLSQKQIKKICKLLEENKLSQLQIANKVGCSRTSVRYILKKILHTDISSQYNIDNYEVKYDFSKKGDESERTKYNDKKVKYVCELIDSGNYSLPEIAKIANIPYQSIRNVYYGSCRKDISKNYNFMKSDLNPLYEHKKEKVIEICELVDTGLNTREVSEKLGIKRSYVRNIYSGRMWKDVSQNYNFIKNKIS